MVERGVEKRRSHELGEDEKKASAMREVNKKRKKKRKNLTPVLNKKSKEGGETPIQPWSGR